MDSSLVHADIFFFVTTITVVVVGIAFTVALVYLSKVLSNIKDITGDIKEETVLVREDIRTMRDDIRREGFRLQQLWKFFGGMGKSKKRETKTRSKQ